MSKYTTRPAGPTGHQGYDVLYEDTILFTIPTEELADVVALALAAEYARGLWEGVAEGYEDGLAQGHEENTDNG